MVLTGHRGVISTVKFDNDIIVTGSVDSTLRVWDAKTGECLKRLEGHEGEIVCVHYNGSVIVTGSEDKTIIVMLCRHVIAHISANKGR
jgi:WD40 repeat protein